MEHNKQEEYLVMEWHRGELIPLKTTSIDGVKGKGKVVKITAETAYQMNMDYNPRGGINIKYVLKSEVAKKAKKEGGETVNKNELDAVKAQYAEVFGKKPFHGWTLEVLKEKIKNKI